MLCVEYFESKKEAFEFAKEVKGVVEGPFIDDEMNVEYEVFYKPKKLKAVQ